MNARALLGLLVVAAALGVTLWLTTEKPDVTKVAELAVLDGRTLTEAKTIRWTFDNRPPIEVDRFPDGRFRIAEPIVDVASMARMKQLIDIWDSAQLQASKVTDSAADLEAAGLATPEVKFLAVWPDGRQIAVDLGGIGPLGDRDTRYVRRDGKVWVGSAALLEALRMGLDDLRERQVFRHAPQHAVALEIDQRLASGQREKLSLKLQNGDWQLTAPIVGRADPTAAQSLLVHVLALRVDEFLAGKLTLPDLEPTVIVRVRGDHGEEELRVFVTDNRQMYGFLPGRNIGFVSANDQYAMVFTDAVDRLRARVLVPLGDGLFEDLAEVLVDPGQGRGERVRLVRESVTTGWRLVEPIEFPAKDTPVNDTALALHQLVALQFVSDETTAKPRANDPRYGLLPQDRLTVTVRGGRDKKPIALWLGGDAMFGEQPAAFACRADEPDTVVLVPRNAITPLRRPFVAYCALDVSRLGQVTIERLLVEHRDGRKAKFELQNDVWQGPNGASRPEVGELANDELRDLIGERAVDARGERYRQPDFTIALQRRSGDEFGRLLFFDDAGRVLQVQFVPAGTKPDARRQVAFELGHSLSKQIRALFE